MSDVKYRHELKHEISYMDMLVIRQRMSAIAKRDSHAKDGKYLIRSLYFDTIRDKALKEKIDGVNRREKFRIRMYNYDIALIHLEKKSKINGLCLKEKARLSAEEVGCLLGGDYRWMMECDRDLIKELYCKMACEGLRPKSIVDYVREPFVYAPGNVRVTIDYDIRTGIRSTDFLNPECLTVKAGSSPIILEVKWDEYLPGIIRDAVQLGSCRTQAFSKYAASRVYG